MGRPLSELHMKTFGKAPPLRQIVILIAYAMAIVAGLKCGYDFGAEISGAVLGVVLAINGAVFCSIVVGMLVEQAERALDKRAAGRDEPGV